MSTAFSFNPLQVAPAQPREARAPGWYPARGITESEVVSTQSGGKMLKITVELEGGGFVWHNFQIENQNQEVVQRAFSDISALCIAVGINHQINDTRELHNRPFDVKLRVEKQDGFDDKNVIASGGFAILHAKADKYVRAAEAPRGAPFNPAAAQMPNGFQPAQQPQQFGTPMQHPAGMHAPQPVQPGNQSAGYQPQQGFQPPAPVQQPMPQAPQPQAPQAPFHQVPQQFASVQQTQQPQAFQQQAAPAPFQPHPGTAPQWTQPR